MTNDDMASGRAPARTYKPRRVDLEGGEALVLRADGSIVHRDRDGGATRTWTPDDPEWPRHALRFGLHERQSTTPPSGRYVPGTRPPPR
jgi:hypothetical protein